MVLFKPVMVEKKADLNTIPVVNGQYVVVIDANELYLDKDGAREKVSQNVYIQADEPSSPKAGDIWMEIAPPNSEVMAGTWKFSTINGDWPSEETNYYDASEAPTSYAPLTLNGATEIYGLYIYTNPSDFTKLEAYSYFPSADGGPEGVLKIGDTLTFPEDYPDGGRLLPILQVYFEKISD